MKVLVHIAALFRLFPSASLSVGHLGLNAGIRFDPSISKMADFQDGRPTNSLRGTNEKAPISRLCIGVPLETVIIMFAFSLSTELFSVVFFVVVAVVVFSHSMTFSLHSVSGMSSNLSFACRARRDSLRSCPRWGVKLKVA